MKADVDWGFACGRHYLTVNGIIVAVAGQRCFDESFPPTPLTGFSLPIKVPFITGRGRTLRRYVERVPMSDRGFLAF